MTTVMILHRQAMSMPRVPRDRRLNAAAAMVLVDTGFLVLCPVVVTMAILAAAAHWATPAHADPIGDSIPSMRSAPLPGGPVDAFDRPEGVPTRSSSLNAAAATPLACLPLPSVHQTHASSPTSPVARTGNHIG
jgi:hypothetical protein